ncbi:hypothetical protein PIIN_07569 [Serendipita indica DSM 11827]|uniref:Cytochrome P450 n=1 Tax=Serendipita indica (strain DSM 11827) TaxID=1109443 RepID=G4TQM3_SERID|nr:hypothetical protein PIIN_07569 [Serendipita indica DSM 11827]
MAHPGDIELRGVYPLADSIVALGTLFVYLASESISKRARKASETLPTGPKQHLALGNVFNFPKDRWHEALTSWGKEYGDIAYVSLAGIDMVLNSLEAVQELTVNRASIYSERPYSIMSNGLHVTILYMACQLTSPGWHKDECFIWQFARFFGDPYEPLMKTADGILTTIAYGETINKEHGETQVELDKQSTKLSSWVFTRALMVDVIPALRYILSWVPATQFKHIAARGACLANEIWYWACGLVKAAVHEADGTADDSIVSNQINKPDISNANLRDAVATMYGAGVDTTAISITNSLYAMVLHQEKIRREMEVALGQGRLPTMEDVTKLETFNKAWKDSFRWNLPMPLGVPNVSNKSIHEKGIIYQKAQLFNAMLGSHD